MTKMKRIGVLTSGGDAPGMNAAIRAVTRCAIYNELEVIGIRRGFEGLLEGDVIPLTSRSVGGIIHRGGTVLRTARSERFKKPEGQVEALDRLKELDETFRTTVYRISVEEIGDWGESVLLYEIPLL